MSDEDGESFASNASPGKASGKGKRVPKKKYYPFGTPSHTFQPYSTFSHLGKDDYLLFKELSTASGIKAEIRTGDEDKRKIMAVKKVDDDFLKYAQPAKSEEGVEQCKRIDCKNVLRKIMESMSTLQIERNDMSNEIENLAQENQTAEQENALLEDKLRIITRENDQLEATLAHLNEQLRKLESKKGDLQQEREEFGNKMMVTETEKQNWLRQVQMAHKALADAIWRGKKQEVHVRETDIIIRRRDPSTPLVEEATSTAYNCLASGDVFDSTERPLGPPTSSIPRYFKSQLLPQLRSPGGTHAIVYNPSCDHTCSGSWARNSKLFAPGSSLADGSGGGAAGSVHSNSSSKLLPIALDPDQKVKKKIGKLRRDNSPFLERSHSDGFRGYTPSGAPNRSFRAHATEPFPLGTKNFGSLRTGLGTAPAKVHSPLNRGRGHHKAVPNFLRTMPASPTFGYGFEEDIQSEVLPWEKLDPVFYNPRATGMFSREESVGRQRVREQADFTKLLTNQHPGLPKTPVHSELAH